MSDVRGCTLYEYEFFKMMLNKLQLYFFLSGLKMTNLVLLLVVVCYGAVTLNATRRCSPIRFSRDDRASDPTTRWNFDFENKIFVKQDMSTGQKYVGTNNRSYRLYSDGTCDYKIESGFWWKRCHTIPLVFRSVGNAISSHVPDATNVKTWLFPTNVTYINGNVNGQYYWLKVGDKLFYNPQQITDTSVFDIPSNCKKE